MANDNNPGEIHTDNHTGPTVPASRRSTTDIWSKRLDYVAKVCFKVLLVPRVLLVLFFCGYDLRCLGFELASVIGCTPVFLVRNENVVVLLWLVCSLFSSAALLYIVWFNRQRFHYKTWLLRKLHYKGSFWSLIFFAGFTFLYYFIRTCISGPGGVSLGISVSLTIYLPLIVLVVCVLNHVPPPHCTIQRGGISSCFVGSLSACIRAMSCCVCRCSSHSRRTTPVAHSKCLLYWLTLIVYFVETLSITLVVMVKAANEVVAIVEPRFRLVPDRFHAILAVLLAVEVAFYFRLVSFFWQKIFHGNKDLFSEPSLSLEEEPAPVPNKEPKQDNEANENILLQETNCRNKASTL